MNQTIAAFKVGSDTFRTYEFTPFYYDKIGGLSTDNPLGIPSGMTKKEQNAFSKLLSGSGNPDDIELCESVIDEAEWSCIKLNTDSKEKSFEEIVDMIDENTILQLLVIEEDFTEHLYKIEHIQIDGRSEGCVIIDLNDDEFTGNEVDIPPFIRGAESQIDTLIRKDILNHEAGMEELRETIVNRVRGANNIVPYSTAFPNDFVESNLMSFIKSGDTTQMLGEAIPKNYDGDRPESVKPWEFPDEVTIPPAFDEIRSELTLETGEIQNTKVENNSQTQTGITGFSNSINDGTDTNESNDETTSRIPIPDSDELPRVDPDPSPHEYDIGEITFAVNGVAFHQFDLPRETLRELETYKEVATGLRMDATEVHECDECRDRNPGFNTGYLTTSDKIDDYKNPYECSYSWWQVRSPVTPHVGLNGESENWVINCSINGEEKLPENTLTDGCTFTFSVTEMEKFTGEEKDALETTTVEVERPPMSELPNGGEVAEFPSKSLRKETNGKEWVLTIRFSKLNMHYEWKRVDDTGDVIKYAYEDAEKRRDREFIGYCPVDVDTDRDDIVVEELAAAEKTSRWEQTCGSTDFTRVWPPRKHNEREINPNDVTHTDVPNSRQHLQRIQSEIDDYISEDTITELIGRLAYQVNSVYPMINNTIGRPASTNDK